MNGIFCHEGSGANLVSPTSFGLRDWEFCVKVVTCFSAKKTRLGRQFLCRWVFLRMANLFRFHKLLLVLLIAGCTAQQKVAREPQPSITALQQHVAYLASDSLEGRRTGTAGEKLAADYIAGQFQKIGLTAMGTDGYLQSFKVSEGREVANETRLSINNEALTLFEHYFPLALGSGGRIDAMSSVALMERGEPWFFNLDETMKQAAGNPHFDLRSAIADRVKEVAGKGASALFVYQLSPSARLLSFDAEYNGTSASIPVIYVHPVKARKFFSDPSALLNIDAFIKMQTVERTGRNVVGFIDNGAPHTIVIGAHYDHLGYGEDHNSRQSGSQKQIHNGADDNASGTAALIELARMIKSSGLKNNNVVFIAFSGEELGLFGSKYFVQQPTLDASKINFMINMDMVGRLNDSLKTLTVGGYGTSPVWGQLYNRTGSDQLYQAGNYRFDSSGQGPSDHTSFYLKNIPVLFYFTGLHTDYHKPSDDFDKINYNGQAAIVNHIFSLVKAADGLNMKLPFLKTKETPVSTTARFKVTLGIMPDYTFSGNGVRADGVSEGRPAEKAGIQAGDVIIALGEYPIGSIEAYMQALSKFKKGDRTHVRFLRNEKEMAADIEF